MSDIEDLRTYVKKYGSHDIAAPIGDEMSNGASVLLTGSHHDIVRDTTAVEVELLTELRFSYYGNEVFQNAGSREDAQYQTDRGKKVIPRKELRAAIANPARPRFPGKLDTLRRVIKLSSKRRFLLIAIGTSREKGRDLRIAQHVRDEVADRDFSTKHRGLISLGAGHAARAPLSPYWKRTTRQYLEAYGFRCVSAYVASNRTVQAGSIAGDTAFRGTHPIHLMDLVPKDLEHIAVPLRRGPFERVAIVRDGKSITDTYEFLILRKIA